eukprot:CAMPEP_0184332078 /NCGR_PEP_ID=MMETSP1089-20130417/1344_1 /TAXON_ID=38269 ORGANISM="Gloeochaete wittrockiana, Strain SAG46.84" /NCGR_SAMPLE_ID=MMETSP1089 /ASSEMBLY_ACC=CAM_ASM_000445 /LENGTH=789 /DNA_ID=CAMNT_0026655307 /DNA_START=206 /DNA_END=2575 /DNA_ORIENTATION=+
MEKLDRLREGIPEAFLGTLQKVETLRSQRRRYNDVSFVDRKYLYLTCLQQLLEQGILVQRQADCCRDFIVSSSFFDAKSLLQYAPHYYCNEKLDLIRSDHSKELCYTIEVQPTYRCCCRFIQLITLSLQFPWRVVMTSMTILQRYCHYFGSLNHFEPFYPQEVTQIGEHYLLQLTVPQRVILCVSCILIASKVEGIGCGIHHYLASLQLMFREKYARLAFADDSHAKTGNGVDVLCDEMENLEVHQVDEKVSLAIILQEEKLLEVLGFKVDVDLPHFYLALFLPLTLRHGDSSSELDFDYVMAQIDSSRAPNNFPDLQIRAFALLDACVMKMGLGLLYPPFLIALAVLFLVFDEEDPEYRCSWDSLSISDSQKQELEELTQLILEQCPSKTDEQWIAVSFSPITRRHSRASVSIDGGISAGGALGFDGPAMASPRVKRRIATLFYQSLKCRSINDFELQKKIFEGTFGVVWSGLDKTTGKTIALKMLKHTRARDGFPYYMLREIICLRRLRHPNILKGFEVVVEKKDLPHHDPASITPSYFIIMEYITMDFRQIWRVQRDIYNAICSSPDGVISEEKAALQWTEANTKHLILQLLQAVAHLHNIGLMHRDIKPENMLFDPHEGRLVLADLGSIRDASRTLLRLTTSVVTIWYRPPELLLESRYYTNSVDIWSVGCLIFEIVALTPLFPANSPSDIFSMIADRLGVPDQASWDKCFGNLEHSEDFYEIMTLVEPTTSLEEMLPEDVDPLLLDLLQRMLVFDPSGRISAQEALSHPYFQSSPLPVVYCPNL